MMSAYPTSQFERFLTVQRLPALSSVCDWASPSTVPVNARVFDFALDSEDYARIDAVQSQSRDLYNQIGDCGDEYRSW